jgi:opacity protein-like surface antigen
MDTVAEFRSTWARGVVVVLAALVAVPAGLSAQNRDYLLGAPFGSFTVRGGMSIARAGSDLFDEITRDYTLERSDFIGFSGDADLAIRVAPRFDIVLSGGYKRSSAQSEYREYEGTDDLPIAQSTQLTTVPLTVSVKAYLTDRGESFGRYAWVPTRWSPYLGAGGGALWYRFRQEGEFIFFETLDIFRDQLVSDGWTGTWHVLGGLEYALGPRFALVGEAKYSFASAEMNQDFLGFEPIDLSGLHTTIGFNVRF